MCACHPRLLYIYIYIYETQACASKLPRRRVVCNSDQLTRRERERERDQVDTQKGVRERIAIDLQINVVLARERNYDIFNVSEVSVTQFFSAVVWTCVLK